LVTQAEGSGTFIVPSQVQVLKITLVGGGSGAGAVAIVLLKALEGTSISYTVGARGLGGSGNGTDGGNTTLTIGSDTITAEGGKSGLFNNSASLGVLGGAGGVVSATNGALLALSFPGAQGGIGYRLMPGLGASCTPFINGILSNLQTSMVFARSNHAQNGHPASSYCAGGQGGVTLATATPALGGDGAPGLIIWEY
jgi:hypothetical protein